MPKIAFGIHLYNVLLLAFVYWTISAGKHVNMEQTVYLISDDDGENGETIQAWIKRNFGIFLDSSPDRWGRVLMDRREAMKARLEDRPRRRLMESDYLPGVYDESRMGALRFKTDEEGPFLDSDPDYYQ